MSSFLNHLGTSAIMDLLLQMVAAPDSDQCRVDLAWVCYVHVQYVYMQLANAHVSAKVYMIEAECIHYLYSYGVYVQWLMY